jgi:hypothetical protein
MKRLSTIFGSVAQVKIMRLFLSNPEEIWEAKDVAQKTKTTSATARKIIPRLLSADMIQRKSFFKGVAVRGKRKLKKKRVMGYTLNPKFPHLSGMQQLLIGNEKLNKDILKKISKTGSVKLLLISGVFLQDPESRVDMVIVGDRFKQNKLDEVIKLAESELGKELRYAFFETDDFKYRLNVYDRLIRDILDYPHEKVVNKLGL